MTAIIAGYARTPFVRFNGQFATVSATTLGAHAVRAALQRAEVDAEDVDRVFDLDPGVLVTATATDAPPPRTVMK
ncbi:hypothetical protein [Diaminobutyricimonas sp. LJ205]|uniref:thiolase family protein n=1 Tax=Diaminobutyricimonas sp. LJ205 TaxID=2683590 RepID=UPI0012F491D0